ncbi:pseudouridylate synthase RPUSD2 [Amia ocellicauda]|uniref:pseudouridylate synthase RPUSD2 n=1 Tax=Amia ocellicauda TaxID=2972642 RepID=UPI003464448B
MSRVVLRSANKQRLFVLNIKWSELNAKSSGYSRDPDHEIDENQHNNISKIPFQKAGRIPLFYSTKVTEPATTRAIWYQEKIKCAFLTRSQATNKPSRFFHHMNSGRFGQMETNESEAKQESVSAAVEPSDREIPAKRKSDEIDEPGLGRRGKKRRGRGLKKLPPGERYVPPPQKRNPQVSFGQEHFDETSYYFEGGLRKVHPYYFDFKTYCKGRWVGKSLLEVFRSEFRAEPLEYYEKAAQKGRIRLNEKPVDSLSVILKNNDFMRNRIHRHEPPVSARPLEILADDGELVVVDKPASLPVHPCGRFRHNTVIFILGKEHGLSGLHTVHRLDRLTSGVLLFARTLAASQKLDQLVRDRQLEKEYVCRVQGEFPEGEIVCEEPILVVSYKVGVCRVDQRGKPCRTVFHRLSSDGCSSVVRCLPLTGRTHQIRVHLQFLGHPILNDPIYCAAAWGPERGKGGVTGLDDEQLLKALVEEHQAKESLHLLDITEVDLPDHSLLQNKDVGGCGMAGGKPDLSVSQKQADTCVGKSDAVGVSDITEVNVAASNLNKVDCCMLDQQHMFLKSNDTESACKTDGKSGRDSGTNGVPPGHALDRTTVEGKCNEMQGDLTKNLDSGGELPVQTESEEAGTKSDCPSVTVVRDPLCGECKIVRKDPTEKDLVMYLHALRYKGPDFEYSTRLPDWAKEDWQEA